MSSNVSSDREAREKTEGMVIREKGPKRRKKEGQAYQALERELALRLNHLKVEVREACEAYIANVESDVSTLVEFLNGTSQVQKPEDVKAATMEAWMKTLDGTSIKPHKGRAKDFRRINRAIRSMMETAFE